MKKITLFGFLFTSFLLLSQNKSLEKFDYNLSFENTNANLPTNWFSIGNNTATIISDNNNIKHEGLKSVQISAENTEGFNGLALTLPNNFEGKIIKISGYIKTEISQDGYAALWMRIDPEIGFDNMNNRRIVGKTDWTQYEIILPLQPEKTDKIVVGALIKGKGKIWMDHFKITIDGNDITNANTFKSNLDPAEANKALDKLLEVTEKISIHKDKVDWKALRPMVKNALNINASNLFLALKPSVEILLDQLDDDHSFLVFNNKDRAFRANAKNVSSTFNKETLDALKNGKAKIKSKMLAGNIGYIMIPGISIDLNNKEKQQNIIGQQVRDQLCQLSPNQLKGIVVDLRLNTGGNMYPMINGIGPLLGNGIAGHFVANGKTISSLKIKDGILTGSSNITNNCKINKDIKIAVLIGNATASSGEITAISFIGKPNVKVIGENSAGFTSANTDIKIADNLYYLLAASYEADRNKKEYKSFITPDFKVVGGDHFDDFEKDEKIKKALEWINQ